MTRLSKRIIKGPSKSHGAMSSLFVGLSTFSYVVFPMSCKRQRIKNFLYISWNQRGVITHSVRMRKEDPSCRFGRTRMMISLLLMTSVIMSLMILSSIAYNAYHMEPKGVGVARRGSVLAGRKVGRARASKQDEVTDGHRCRKRGSTLAERRVCSSHASKQDEAMCSTKHPHSQTSSYVSEGRIHADLSDCRSETWDRRIRIC